MRQKQGVFSLFLLSPSSRRAWIEIQKSLRRNNDGNVALLAEGVDRNSTNYQNCHNRAVSPSSRRAWIEIQKSLRRNNDGDVALLAEGVDRN